MSKLLSNFASINEVMKSSPMGASLKKGIGKVLFVIILSVLAIPATADPVTPERACAVAQRFVASVVKADAKQIGIVYTRSMPETKVTAFYVVNVGDGAFVIVAGDDAARPVLGYSTSRAFPQKVERLPDNVDGWFAEMARQVAFAAEHQEGKSYFADQWERLSPSKEVSKDPSNQDYDPLPTTQVGPLLTTTWDQGQYYNALCPEDVNGPDGHVLTGCVATAMAQIINYWGYPIHGRGSHSYDVFGLDTGSMCGGMNLIGYGPQVVNFDSATYDYANMPSSLTSSSTPEQINAVAKLMYHCGVSVNMFYDANSSGAYDEDVRSALISYFGFSHKLGYAQRQLYTDEEWNDSLKANIDRGEPVLYSGYDVLNNGHSFVLDGYNQEGFFHFNFGWSGSCDGWFLHSAINVGFGFNALQTAIMGICPDSNSHSIICHRKMSVQNIDIFKVSTPIDLYPERRGSEYRAINEMTGVGVNLNLLPADSLGQLILDVVQFDREQSVVIYDGTQKDSLVRVIETRNLDDYSTVTFRNWLYDGRPSDTVFQQMASTDFSPVVSTRHGFTIVVYSYGGIPEQFHLRVRNTTDTASIDTLRPSNVYWTDVVTSEPEGYQLDGDTIRITSPEGLAWLSHCVDSMRRIIDYDPYFEKIISIEDDLDLAGYLWAPFHIGPGNVEGNGHVVKNVRVNTSKWGGLFASATFSKINNLGIADANINSVDCSGALLGHGDGVTLLNCYTKGHTICSGNSASGGLIGYAINSSITNCFAYGDIYAQFGYGGLAGTVINSDFVNCATNHSKYFNWLSGIQWDGPRLLAYTFQGDRVNRCFADISGLSFAWPEGDSLAKLETFIGSNNYATVSNLAAFTISDDSTSRILPDAAVNYTLGDDMDVATALNNMVIENNSADYRMWIRDSVSHLPIFGDFYVVTCPNVSNITAENIPYNDGFSVALSWQRNGSEEEWQIKYNIENAPEDSATIINVNSMYDTIPDLRLGNDYVFYVRPICGVDDSVGWGEPFYFYVDKALWIDVVTSQPDGYFEDGNNVIISSPEGLAWLAKNRHYYRQDTIIIVSDLDMGAYRWTPIGQMEFRGVVEGGNHIISNIYCKEKITVDNENTNYIGLFGHAIDATFRNIIIKNSDFSGYQYVGGLLGLGENTMIDNCHVVNSIVRGMYSVGGLGGGLWNSEGVSVSKSFNSSSSGEVYGNQNVGGLFAGVSSVKNCYTTCSVMPLGIGNKRQFQADRGGLCGGVAEVVVNNCYSAGTVGYANGDKIFGTSVGEIWSGEIRYVYARQIDSIPFVGRISSDNESVAAVLVSDTSSIVNGDLQTPISIANTSYSNLVDVLNAWVDTYDTLGIYRHWAADSANVNNGFPVFTDMPCTPLIHTITTVRACESYTWNDSTYTQSTIINDTLQTADGCDSISSIIIKIGHPTSGYEERRICPGDSYTFNGRILTETGSYYDTIIGGSSMGCDSIVQLWLEVQAPTSWNDARICEGESYSWRGKTLTETNSYYDTIPNGATNGCDSIVYLWLEVRSDYSYSEAKICQGDSYFFRDNNLTQSGFYQDTLAGASAAGCDSIVQLNLIVNPSYNLYDTLVVPEGSLPYLYSFGDWTDDVDDFSVTMNNDIQTIDTRVKPSGTIFADTNYFDYFDGMVILAANPGETIKLTGQYNLEGCCNYLLVYDGYGESGNNLLYTCGNGSVDLQSSTGFMTIRSFSVCEGNREGFVLTWNTQSHRDTLLSAAGDYILEAHTENGCDSTINLRFDVRSPYIGTDSIAICSNNLPYAYADTLIYDAGTYTFHYLDRYGIDSTRILILSVISALDSVETVTACDSYTWNGTTYTTTGDYTYSHSDAKGCTQVDTLHLTINTPIHAATTETACDSYTWNGTTYTTSGDYTYSHSDANGCTQVDTLHLTVNTPIHAATTETACDSYTWNGTTYTTTGDYTYSHSDANGCTQVDTLHLTVNTPIHAATTETACDSYTWNGTTYTATGDYTYSHSDANGCTQVDTLHLTINTPIHTASTETACDSYTWNGTTYTTTGDYTYSHSDANGCTQVDTLHLTINTPIHAATTDTACDSYTWNGTTYTTTGDYTYSHSDANGCTQVDTLHLSVNYSVMAYDTLSINSNELPYDYHGNSIIAGGDFIYNGTTTEGCDSTTNLHVIVNQVGIEDVKTDDGITLFPNPTSGMVTVEGAGLERIEVVDIVGRKVKDVVCQSDSEKIDLSDLPQGAYTLRIVSHNGVSIRKVVKQ